MNEMLNEFSNLMNKDRVNEFEYAKLSKLASQVGGPEKFIEIVFSDGETIGYNNGFEKGCTQGRIEGVILTTGLISIGTFIFSGVSYFKNRKRKKILMRQLRDGQYYVYEKFKTIKNNEKDCNDDKK